MFGTNSIAGKGTFKDAPANSLLVTSIFFTLQGEGPFSGKPAVFVRLAKCNLSCNFCDTFFDAGDWMPFDEVIAKAKSAIDEWHFKENGVIPGHVKNRDEYNALLVITGGEPLLQPNLTQFCIEASYHFTQTQIESNGIPNTPVPGSVHLVCSPKCKEVSGVATEYLKPSKTVLERADYLKFVMSSDKSSPYSEIPDWALEWHESKPGQVYVSPMNIYNDLPHKAKLLRATKGEITMLERSTVDEVISFWEPGLLNMKQNQLNHEYTARYAMKHGLNFNLQTHLYAGLA